MKKVSHTNTKKNTILHRSYTVSTWPATGPSHAEAQSSLDRMPNPPAVRPERNTWRSPWQRNEIEPIPWSNPPQFLRSNEFYWYSYIYIYISNIPYYSSGVRLPLCNNPQKTDNLNHSAKKTLFCKLCEFISVKQSPSPVKISNKNHRSIFPPIMVRWQMDKICPLQDEKLSRNRFWVRIRWMKAMKFTHISCSPLKNAKQIVIGLEIAAPNVQIHTHDTL